MQFSCRHVIDIDTINYYKYIQVKSQFFSTSSSLKEKPSDETNFVEKFSTYIMAHIVKNFLEIVSMVVGLILVGLTLKYMINLHHYHGWESLLLLLINHLLRSAIHYLTRVKTTDFPPVSPEKNYTFSMNITYKLNG